MPIKQRLTYAILSGLLLSLPWHESFSGIFLWIAFIPLLLIEDYYFANFQKPKKEVFLYSSLAFLIWNVSTTWWIAQATMVGFLAAIMVNTFLFSTIFYRFWLGRWGIKKRLSDATEDKNKAGGVNKEEPPRAKIAGVHFIQRTDITRSNEVLRVTATSANLVKRHPYFRPAQSCRYHTSNTRQTFPLPLAFLKYLR